LFWAKFNEVADIAQFNLVNSKTFKDLWNEIHGLWSTCPVFKYFLGVEFGNKKFKYFQGLSMMRGNPDYRSYWGRFLRVKWPNQQCQRTEGKIPAVRGKGLIQACASTVRCYVSCAKLQIFSSAKICFRLTATTCLVPLSLLLLH